MILIPLLLTLLAGNTPYAAAASEDADSLASARRSTLSRSPGEERRAILQLPSEMAEYRSLAGRFADSVRFGRVILLNPERDGGQIERLNRADADCASTLDLQLLKLISVLAERSSRDKPLKISSLVRSRMSGRPNEPHANGQAVDITAFAGFEIKSANPQDCESAALALIGALPEGPIRFGLPMPPGCEPVPFLEPPDRRPDWPFFPPPLPQLMSDLWVVAPKERSESSKPPVRHTPIILGWAYGRYAPLPSIQSKAVRDAIEAARLCGVQIHSLFPDGANHIHIDVKPAP